MEVFGREGFWIYKSNWWLLELHFASIASRERGDRNEWESKRRNKILKRPSVIHPVGLGKPNSLTLFQAGQSEFAHIYPEAQAQHQL